jgi:predicted alpha/beta-fold hydrolase
MNEWDRDNLEFLLALGTDEFDAWMEQADHEDIIYAMELIRQARTELTVQTMDLQDAEEFYEKKSDFPEALEVINRIKNVGKI